MTRRMGWLLVIAIIAAAWWVWATRPSSGPQATAQPLPAPATTALPTATHPAPPAPETSAPQNERDAAPTQPAGMDPRAAQAAFREALQRGWNCRAEAPADDLAEDWALGLPPAQLERARAERAAAIDWARRVCTGLPQALRTLEFKAAASAALRAGDPWARLAQVASQKHDRALNDAQIDELRRALDAVLPAALAEPDPVLFAMIERAIESAPQALGERVAGSAQAMIWPLVACDLGAECGPDSDFMRRLCLQEALCGYPDVASALRDGLWPMGSAEHFEQRRRTLLAQLRAGGAGVFAAPAPPSPGGG